MRFQSSRTISVRPVRPNFNTVGCRLWFQGDRFRTALFNAYTMLLCDEFEFVDIVRKYLPEVRDEAIRAQLKAWLGQEASHGVQHRKACVYLDQAGLRYKGFHKVVNFLVFRALFPAVGRKFRIALIAALEHFNTMLGEMCLRHPDYFSNSDRELSLLLSWHFAEEIEHRAVIHDVAQSLGVGYFTRVVAGGVAFLLYSAVLMLSTIWFSIQSSDWLRISSYFQMFRFLFVRERFVQLFIQYSREYFGRGFHPLTRNSDCYAEPVFRSLALPKRGGAARRS